MNVVTGADGAASSSPTALIVVGTRPELIKLAGVIAELRRRAQIAPYVVFTGQHRELVENAAVELGVEPDQWLCPLPNERSLTHLMAHVVGNLGEVVKQISPACVVVQGDTVSALSGAITSELLGVPLAHVEAGVRSMRRDDPFPEETIRRMISPISEFHICFSESAREELLREGHDTRLIRVVANPLRDRVFESQATQSVHENCWRVLATLHRRERRSERLDSLLEIVASLRAEGLPVEWRFVWHPALDAFHTYYRRALEDVGVAILDPMEPASFLEEMQAARVIMTDSAGVSEESHMLGKPLLSYRLSTEKRFDDGMSDGSCITESPSVATSFMRRYLGEDRLSRPRVLPEPPLVSASSEIAGVLEAWVLRLPIPQAKVQPGGGATIFQGMITSDRD